MSGMWASSVTYYKSFKILLSMSMYMYMYVSWKCVTQVVGLVIVL